MLMMTFSPISIRPSIVADPMCGSSKNIIQTLQARVDIVAVFKNIQPRTGQFPRPQHTGQGVFVDNLAPGRVDDIGRRLHQFQAACIQQMERAGGVRAVDCQDIDPRQHLVQTFPIGRLQRLFGIGMQTVAVVVMHLQPEGPRTPRHSLTDPAHPQNTQPFAANPVPHQGRGGPALPFALLHQHCALAQAARNGQNHRHRHIGRVVGQNAGGVGYHDPALQGGLHVRCGRNPAP